MKQPSHRGEQAQPLLSPVKMYDHLPDMTGKIDMAAAGRIKMRATTSGSGVGVRWIQGIISVPAGLGTLPDELIVQPLLPALPPAHIRRTAVTTITAEDRPIPLPARFIVRIDYLEQQSLRSLRLAPPHPGGRIERDLLLHRLSSWHRGHVGYDESGPPGDS